MANKEILLFHPRTFHEKNYRNFWIPYSILSIGSELYKNGYDVILIDNNLNSLNPTQFPSILNKLKNPEFIGISSMIGHQIQEGLQFAQVAKDVFPKTKIVWGGAAPTMLGDDFINSPLVDIVVKAQGEKTIVELAKALESGKALGNVRGLLYKNRKKTIKSPEREILPKDAFAPYNYNLLPTERYLRNDEHINSRVLNYVSSQGCPFECGFCSEVSLYHRHWVAEPAERIIREISVLIENYNANGIKFYDANFFVNKLRVLSFAQKVLEKGRKIRWAASAHPKNLLSFSKEELNVIKKSGCSRILIGAESGNNEELEYIKKNITTGDVIKVAKMLKQVEIHGSFTIIVGYPGFPEGNIKKTLDFGEKIAKISPLHEVKAHLYIPYPETPLYNQAIQYGFVPPKTLDEWSNYDYYEVQTPWLKNNLNDIISEYNKKNCPYVL